MKLKTNLFCLTLILNCTLWAQDLEKIRKDYPGYDVVILNHSIHYKFAMVNGKPEATSNETQQLYYVSPGASSYMSQYSFHHSSFHQVQEYQAYTRTADSRKIKVTDFRTSDNKSQSIFYDDVKETSFDFPAIAPGATGTLETSMKHPDAHLLSPFYFRRGVPVLNAELKITCPQEIRLRYVFRGLDTSDISVKKETRRGETTYTFRGQNLAAEQRYADAPDNSYYSTHLVFFIESYTDQNGKQIPYLSGPDDLYKMNRTFIGSINKKVEPHLQAVIDSLKTGNPSTEVLAEKIYKWVQHNIKYVAFEEGLEGFVPRDANLVCSRRFGDCKDMSSILMMMLNNAGIPAYFTWIGTRNLPYRYVETPTPIVDNHMICAIKLQDKYVFLDGTDPTCAFGLVPQGIQGKEALIAVSETEYEIVTVPVIAKEFNMVNDTTVLRLTNEGIVGTVKMELTGYPAMDFHGTLLYTSEKDLEKKMKEKLHRGSNKFQLTNYIIGDKSKKDKISLSGNYTLHDYAKKVMDEYYVNLNLFRFFEHQQIDYPKRKIPVEIDYKYISRYVTILEIPDGYKAGYIPEAVSYSNDIWGYSMKYELSDKRIMLTQEFHNNHLLLQPADFQQWNLVLEHLLPNYNESVSLEKK